MSPKRLIITVALGLVFFVSWANCFELDLNKDAGFMNDFGSSFTGSRDLETLLNQTEKSIVLEKLRQEIRSRLNKYKSEVEFVHELGTDDGVQIEDKDIDNANLSTEDENNSTSQHSKTKSRRAVIEASKNLPSRNRRNITHLFESGGIQVVSRIYRRQPQPFDNKLLADLNSLKVKSDLYLFALEYSTEGEEALVVYKVQTGLNPKEIIHLNSPGAFRVKPIQIHDQYYVLVAAYKKSGTDPLNADSKLYQIDFSTNQLTRVQRLNTEFARSFETWVGIGEEANDNYLAVAPEAVETQKGYSTHVNISIYNWHTSYFDLAYKVPAKSPQAISFANIYSHGYLAVANFQDDTKSTSVYSEIFKYNHKDHGYVLSQKILTYGAKGIKYFSLTGKREEHFLAIANFGKTDEKGKINHHVKSRILKYAREGLIPFQGLDTYGAYDILTTKDSQGHFLLIICELRGFRVFQYNGWKFIQTYVLPLGHTDISPQFIKSRTFVFEGQPYLSVASLNKQVEGGIYALEFSQKGHNKLTSDVEAWCLTTLATVQAVNMTELERAVDYAPKFTDKEVILKSSLVFKKDVKARELFTKKLTYKGLVFDSQLSRQLAEREAQLLALRHDAGDIYVKLDQTIMRNKKQDVKTHVVFEDVEYSGSKLVSDAVSTVFLNGINIEDLLKNTISLKKDYTFNTVSIPEVTAEDVQIHQLNGRPLSSYALKSSPVLQTFTSVNRFDVKATAIEGFQSQGTVDGLDFNDVQFLLQSNQSFPEMNIKDSTTNNLYAEIVNGVNIKQHMDDAVPKSGPVTIKGITEFKKIQVENWDVDESINGFRIKHIFTDPLLLSDSEQIFTGARTQFEDLAVRTMEITDGLINEKYKIESDLISTSTGTYHLDSLEILTDTEVTDLTVKKSLNKIKVINGKLDLIHKSSRTTQLIANKVLDAIKLEKDSQAEGLVDNVQLNGWSHKLEIELAKNNLNVGELKIDGMLTTHDGILIDHSKSRFTHDSNDISHILSNAIRLDAGKLPEGFDGKLIFESADVKGNTELVNTINGFRTDQWLHRNPKGDNDEVVRVTGTKIFNINSDLHLRSPSTTGRLFGEMHSSAKDVLKEFDDLLINGMDQTIKRTTTFNELLVVDKLECPGLKLNEVWFKDLFFTSGDQDVNVRTSFLKELRVNSKFEINGDVEAKIINGRDIAADIKDTLRTSSSTPQVITGKVALENGFRLKNLIIHGLLGGENATTLFNGIIRNDNHGSKTIHGSITFAKEVELETLEYTGTLNGVNHKDWGQGLLLASGRQTITTPTTFKNSVKADSVYVANGKVSNFDIVKFASEMLRIDQGGTLGVVYFDNAIRVEKGILLGQDATVNGYNLNKDVLLKNSAKTQTITANKEFQRTSSIAGDLQVKYLAGFLYDQAAKFAFGKTIPSDNLLIKGNLKMKNEPFFTDLFNGEHWADLIKGIWWSGEDTTIQVPVEFTYGLDLEDGGTVKGTVNNVSLAELNAQYLSKSKDQVITGGPTYFEKGVTFESLSVKNIQLGKEGRVNGVNLQEFRDSVILDGVDQHIKPQMSIETLHIQNIILEQGKRVGGIDLDQEAMTIHGENIVIGGMTFDNLHIEDLTLGKGTMLNKIDLEKWYTNTAKLDEANVISGDVHFTKAEFSKGVTVHGKVDGLEYSRSKILTLSGDQHIEGFYNFVQNPEKSVGAFMVPKGFIVDGRFNGLRIPEDLAHLVKDNGGTEPLTVTGVKTFHQKLSADTVQAEGLFQENDLDAVIKDLEAKSHIKQEDFNFSLEDKYQELSKIVDHLTEVSNRRAKFLDYYEWVGLLRVDSVQLVKAITSFGVPKVIMVTQLTTESQGIVSRIFDEKTTSYRPHESPQITIFGLVQDFVIIEKNRDEHYGFITMNGLDGNAAAFAKVPNQVEFQESDLLGRAFLLKCEHVDEEKVTPPFTIKQVFFADTFGEVVSIVQYDSFDKPHHCVGTIADIASDSKVLVLCFENSKDQVLKNVQSIPTTLPSAISSMVVKNFKTLLIIATESKDDLNGVVDVYSHDKGNGYYKKEQCIPVVNLVSMDASKGFNNNAFLALATGSVKGSLNYGGVYIYKYSNSRKQFEKYLTIPVEDPVQVLFQHIEWSKESFLYVLTDSNQYNVQVYSLRGGFSWSLEHKLTIAGAQQLESAIFQFKNNYLAQLLVQSDSGVHVFGLEFNGLTYHEVRIGSSLTKSTRLTSSKTIIT